VSTLAIGRFPWNESMKNKNISGNGDKMKDHAIAQLSDQFIALTTRMQEFDRKQQPCVS
jgi:hypothetical protein